jgi:hypothetical protein
MKLEMETGAGFMAAAQEPEFRERIYRWVRRVSGIPGEAA